MKKLSIVALGVILAAGIAAPGGSFLSATTGTASDGHAIAFIGDADGSLDLYVMNQDGSNVQQLTNDDSEKRLPQWSPDGSLILFERDDIPGLQIVTENGEIQATIPGALEADWSPDGDEITYVGGDGQVHVVEASGANDRTITSLDLGALDPTPSCLFSVLTQPRWSPDGSAIAFGVSSICFEFPSVQAPSLYRVDPDGSNLVLLASPPETSGGGGIAWSPDSTEIAFGALDVPASWVSPCSDLFVVGAGGAGLRHLTTSCMSPGMVSWSPIGDQVAFKAQICEEGDCYSEVYVVGADGTNLSRITDLHLSESPQSCAPACSDFSAPSWAPNGVVLTFSGSGDVYVISPDGVSLVNLTESASFEAHPDWSPAVSGVVPLTQTPTPTPPPTSTPDPHSRDVLFITGINSNAHCGIGSGPGDRWYTIANTLKTALDMTDADFLEYDYTRGDAHAQGCGLDNHFAEFDKHDACWSLNDTYSTSGSLIGQGQRLAEYLNSYLEANPNARLSIVAHSQGGLLALYTLRRFVGEYPSLSRVESVVTLDSPLKGINSLGGLPLAMFAGCKDMDSRHDSAFDMQPRTDVVQLVNSSNPTGWPRTYTVNETGNDCFTIPLLGERCIQLVDADHSTVKWASDSIDVHTGNHGSVWNGSGNQGEQRVLKRYIACVIGGLFPEGKCSDYAREMADTVPLHDYLAQSREVPAQTSIAYFRSEWSGSTVTTSLVSPTGRVIDAETVAADVVHEAGATWEQFDITNPEPGEWTVRLYGEDVPAEGEETYLSVITVPSASIDQDADAVSDSEDNCPSVWNPTQTDAESDDIGDACDLDNDNDGVLNDADNCEFLANPDQIDANANGIGDACDPDLQDLDGDGMLDGVDNCPFVPNPDQADINGNGIGDVCEEAASPVGGIAEYPELRPASIAQSGSLGSTAFAALAVGGVVLLLAAGGWVAVRRRAR